MASMVSRLPVDAAIVPVTVVPAAYIQYNAGVPL